MSGALNSSGKVVLVVEDAGLVRMLLVEVLDAAGFQVLEAKTADAAMVLITARPDIAAVVTDIAMPGSMDGLGLARWMRTFAPHISIVIATGREELPNPGDINPAIVGVLAKPYPAQKVIDLLHAAVRP